MYSKNGNNKLMGSEKLKNVTKNTEKFETGFQHKKTQTA
jgi:hypothetical protein